VMLYVGIQLIILLEEREQYKEMYKGLPYVPKNGQETLAACQSCPDHIGQRRNHPSDHICNAGRNATGRKYPWTSSGDRTICQATERYPWNPHSSMSLLQCPVRCDHNSLWSGILGYEQRGCCRAGEGPRRVTAGRCRSMATGRWNGATSIGCRGSGCPW
jgi:hypothetical protein